MAPHLSKSGCFLGACVQGGWTYAKPQLARVETCIAIDIKAKVGKKKSLR